jgi:hypothetical protein
MKVSRREMLKTASIASADVFVRGECSRGWTGFQLLLLKGRFDL